MTDESCETMRLLVQADVDGELSPAETASVAAHLEHCRECEDLQRRLGALSGQLRQDVTYHPLPEASRQAILRNLAAIAPPETKAPAVANDNATRWWRALARPRVGTMIPFGAGVAAAALAFVLVVPQLGNMPLGNLPREIVSDHIRALQPGHLMDVVSTDQHTVKPWFDGRLDFAPPVKDFKAEGFPLTGGRLDYVAGKQAAALIYHRGQHVINLYVWPSGGHADTGPADGTVSGYNYVHWVQNGMEFWAVSDVEAGDLAGFVRLMRAA